jgi:hypothetical protein
MTVAGSPACAGSILQDTTNLGASSADSVVLHAAQYRSRASMESCPAGLAFAKGVPMCSRGLRGAHIMTHSMACLSAGPLDAPSAKPPYPEGKVKCVSSAEKCNLCVDLCRQPHPKGSPQGRLGCALSPEQERRILLLALGVKSPHVQYGAPIDESTCDTAQPELSPCSRHGPILI